MDQWRLCTRCGLGPGRAREDEPDNYLCDECDRRIDLMGEAAADLSHILMRWRREQEWRGIDPEVLLEAAGLSFALFEGRVLAGAGPSYTPQLLHAEYAGDALELTLAKSPTSVWRESFGAWDSPHDRVPFLVVTEADVGPADVTLHYWDKREKAACTLGFWSGEDQVLEDFALATEARAWGVPWSVVQVGGLKEESSQAVEDLRAIAGSLGFFPATGSRDAAEGTAAVELAGDVSGDAREQLLDAIARSLACDPRAVSIREGTLAGS